ncbi:MAG: DMT family transporter [Bacteroidetes bacterium]|nr:DMT family transporter [Bacteroidota bacterium]
MKYLVHIALFSVSLIYAVTFSLVKDIMPHYLQGFGFIILRVCGAALLFLLASQFGPKEHVHWKQDGKRILLCSALGVAANMLMFFKGLEITTPINGAVLMLATPIFVFVLNVAINKQQVVFAQLIGIVLACAGCVVLMAGRNFSFNSNTLPGDVLIILNAISYAGYLVAARKLLQQYHTLTVSKYTFLIGSVLVIPFGFEELMHGKFSEMPSDIILKILFIIIFTTFVTYLLNAWAITKAGPTIVGAYIYLQPILASIIAILLKKDDLNMQKILAILLIFAGVFITSTKNKWYKSKA